MNRDSVDWWGPMPAVITPFDADGKIDAAAMQENVDRRNDGRHRPPPVHAVPVHPLTPRCARRPGGHRR
ncbi:MAG: hypothetical protein QNJ00_04680, partial [Woeseiaceae bacterium]|nr:hypothetical protein [Woeseiaceae bacterium]